jgi:hypothetical protein
MASTYEPIATTTLGSASATVTFSSIPGTYTDLVVVINCISTTTASAFDKITAKFNGSSASDYSQTFLFGNGTVAGSSRASGGTYIYAGDISTKASSNLGPSTVIWQINNYSNTTTNKTLLSRCDNAPASGFTEAVVGLWRSTSAVTSITATSDYTFEVGSTFTLYGILKA